MKINRIPIWAKSRRRIIHRPRYNPGRKYLRLDTLRNNPGNHKTQYHDKQQTLDHKLFLRAISASTPTAQSLFNPSPALFNQTTPLPLRPQPPLPPPSPPTPPPTSPSPPSPPPPP